MAYFKTKLLGIVLLGLSSYSLAKANELEIHYINVGQGGSTLIKGPNGTTILYDFGKVSGMTYIVPYLKEQAGLNPSNGINYAILSHADKDHYMGYRDLVDKLKGNFDITTASFEPGTPKQSSTFTNYLLQPAKNTKAGAFKPIPLGFHIDLGDGAKVTVMAANSYVLGDEISDKKRDKAPSVLNENDRSISLFINYGKFQYILDGDLGSGRETCSGHDTSQMDVQTRVARKLLSLGLMQEKYGVDVLHIAHHGSESSTSWAYYQLVKPEVGVISVGPDQGNFLHPRVDVVEKVLTCKTGDGKFRADACSPPNDTRANCDQEIGVNDNNKRAPALKALYQTDYGLAGTSNTGIWGR